MNTIITIFTITIIVVLLIILIPILIFYKEIGSIYRYYRGKPNGKDFLVLVNLFKSRKFQILLNLIKKLKTKNHD